MLVSRYGEGHRNQDLSGGVMKKQKEDLSGAQSLLDILSSGAPENEGHKHSLCQFCGHRDKDCLHGSNRTGMCDDFRAVGSIPEIQDEVLQYLTTQPTEPQAPQAFVNPETRLAA